MSTRFFRGCDFGTQSIAEMSHALESVCGSLGLPIVESAPTLAIADQIIELAQRGVSGEDALRFMALRYLDDLE